MNKIGFAALVWFYIGTGNAQDTGWTKNFTDISLKLCYGFIADVGKDNYLLIRSHIVPVEITLSGPVVRKYDWYKIVPNVEKGISIKYIHLSNPECLRNLYSVAPFIKVTLWDTRFWRLDLRSSLGLAFVTKIYQRTENYRNTIFGSHLNAAANFALENSFQVSNVFALKTGIDFSHFSNGETIQPNEGMNIGTLFFSTAYRFSSHKTHSTKINPNHYDNKHFTLLPAAGWKDILQVQSRKYLTAAISVEYGISLNALQKIGAGTVLFYDGTMKPIYEIHRNEGTEIKNQYREFTCGAYLFHDVNLYPLIIHIEGGYFLMDDRIEDHSRIFNRFGIRYFLTDNLFFNLTHKSHFFFKGDNLEWGIGYIF